MSVCHDASSGKKEAYTVTELPAKLYQDTQLIQEPESPAKHYKDTLNKN
jgi:hypothetical protein